MKIIIICKEYQDLLLFIYSTNNYNFFNEIKKCLVRYYSKDLKEKKCKDQQNKQQQSLNVKFIDFLKKDEKKVFKLFKR